MDSLSVREQSDSGAATGQGDRPRYQKYVIISVAVVASILLIVGLIFVFRPHQSTTSTTTLNPDLPYPYACKSNVMLDSKLSNMDIKGMAMDDQTMSTCPDQIMGVWPNTNDTQIKSLRIFAAWKSTWGGDSLRLGAWQQLERFVKTNGVKILFGVDTHGATRAERNENDKQWAWGLELMKRLGKEHIMGMSFGNEMLNKGGIDWDGYIFPWVTAKIAEMDKAGFQDVKVLFVWSMKVFDSIKDPEKFPFLKKMVDRYPDRWVWSVNPYPIWDSNLWPTGPGDCKQKIAAATGSYTKNVITDFRKAVTTLTGKKDDPLWIGETGWSSPFTNSQQWLKGACPEWASVETIKAFYKNILEWDGSLHDDVKGVDHIFYFSNRDSNDHGDRQPFGLVENCGDLKCKIQEESGSSQDISV